MAAAAGISEAQSTEPLTYFKSKEIAKAKLEAMSAQIYSQIPREDKSTALQEPILCLPAFDTGYFEEQPPAPVCCGDMHNDEGHCPTNSVEYFGLGPYAGKRFYGEKAEARGFANKKLLKETTMEIHDSKATNNILGANTKPNEEYTAGLVGAFENGSDFTIKEPVNAAASALEAAMKVERPKVRLRLRYSRSPPRLTDDAR
jgi:hypothetical protein